MTDAPQNDPAMPKMKQYAPIASLLTSRLTQYPDPRPTAMANTINNRSPLPTPDAAMSPTEEPTTGVEFHDVAARPGGTASIVLSSRRRLDLVRSARPNGI
jgi:hypothetical protein